ncbi:SpaA isopeptide-forming pilin-related protein [Streptomyces sp. NPDC101118]|uniref:prealbumin-like fold domain-containing protein n=1 Tax=Streptomyces sp. NPDC101118 TaxID=3366109 RepID=UPI0037F6B787
MTPRTVPGRTAAARTAGLRALGLAAGALLAAAPPAPAACPGPDGPGTGGPAPAVAPAAVLPPGGQPAAGPLVQPGRPAGGPEEQPGQPAGRPGVQPGGPPAGQPAGPATPATPAGQATPATPAGQAAFAGTVRVVASDAKNGDRVPGSVFELWAESNGKAGLQTREPGPDREVLPDCSTDDNGICEWTALPKSDYYVRSVDISEGYELPDQTVKGPVRLGSGSAPPKLVRVYFSHPRTEPIESDGEDARRTPAR